jgi:ATP-dependent helicase Lhr and Lhr-like helicase
MLVSAVMDPRVLLGSVRAVVVDEIHAFAGDDRGWHLLALLASVAELAGPAAACRIVGHSRQCARPADLAAGRGRQSQLGGEPAEHGPVMADVEVDYVGSLTNAAKVIAGLHRGEKRLVFAGAIP